MSRLRLKTSIKTITYLSDTGCLEIQGASLERELSEYPPEKIYQVRREGEHLSLKNYGDDITLNRDTAVATVQITVSRKCITQEEMDELYALSERLKEKCAGN
nr:hypothetical protein [Escherichia coli]